MQVFFINKKLEKKLKNPRVIQKNYGERAHGIGKIIWQLKMANNFAELFDVSFHHEQLGGNYQGIWSCHLNKNWRLLYRPYGDVPTNQSGQPDWSQVKKLEITGIEDYH